MDLFEHAITITLQHEGGYVNDPADPGGETRYGISKRAFPKVDIANLTINKAKAIYKAFYWERQNGCKRRRTCLELPLPLMGLLGLLQRNISTATLIQRRCYVH